MKEEFTSHEFILQLSHDHSVMKKAISDFTKISTNPEHVADLMLSYVEYGVELTNIYGDIDEKFYRNLYRMFDESMIQILNMTLKIRFMIDVGRSWKEVMMSDGDFKEPAKSAEGLDKVKAIRKIERLYRFDWPGIKCSGLFFCH